MQLFVLGNGVMASAMIEALKADYEITVVGRSDERLAKFRDFGLKTELYNGTYDISNKNIILAFKPYALGELLPKFSGQAKNCISVLAGVKFGDLSALKTQNLAVCIPNIAAKFGKSVTPYMFKGADDAEILRILDHFGSSVRVSSEMEFDTAGVISGCAPAYLMLAAEALANGGVAKGLKSEISLNLVRGLFESASVLLKEKHPAIIKDEICSPNGTTIEGVKVLEEFAVRSAFINAISASVEKTKTK